MCTKMLVGEQCLEYRIVLAFSRRWLLFVFHGAYIYVLFVLNVPICLQFYMVCNGNRSMFPYQLWHLVTRHQLELGWCVFCVHFRKMFDFVHFGLLFQVHLGKIPQMMLNDALAKKIVPFKSFYLVTEERNSCSKWFNSTRRTIQIFERTFATVSAPVGCGAGPYSITQEHWYSALRLGFCVAEKSPFKSLLTVLVEMGFVSRCRRGRRELITTGWFWRNPSRGPEVLSWVMDGYQVVMVWNIMFPRASMEDSLLKNPFCGGGLHNLMQLLNLACTMILIRVGSG